MRWRRMLLSFASAAMVAPAVWAGGGAGAGPNARAVVVLSSSGAPAYREAVAGFRSTMGGSASPEIFEMGGRDNDILTRIQAAKPRLVVAIGSGASAAAASLDVPVLSAMVMEAETGALPAGSLPKRMVSRIPLDVPPRTALARLKRLFPDRRRIAVIWGPSGSGRARAEILSAAAVNGLTVKFVECGSPKEMLEAVPALSGAVDLVWCLPDRALYEPAPVQALILASIRARLPLIGFSAGFVKAGALAGFQADYGQIGVQTAEAALQFLEGAPLKVREDPRVVRTIVNERAVRIFGIGLRTPPGGEEMVLVK
jgi:putative tryptophan/tyrosine transport system substrate-binding protein